MAVSGFLAADWYILMQMEQTLLVRLICAIVFVLALLAASLMMWVFPTLARFDLTNRQIIHNAVIHMFARLPQTLLGLAAAVGGFILASLFPQVLPLVTFFVPAFVVWYMSRTCVKRFRKFDRSLEEEQEEAAREKSPQDNLQTIQLN